MRYVVLACAAGALLSLLVLPSAPLHDQWAWIVWGRELVHLDLDASAGPAWKPLPVAVTGLLSIFGGAAPSLWLAVARFGGLLSLAVGYRLAGRLGGWSAGVAAVIALLSSWLVNVSLGIAEGLLVGLLLWAIERHLDGRRPQALALAFAAALIRPEVWPFLGLYGLWLWFADRSARTRLLVAALLALVPVLWFAPDALLVGEPLRSSEEAQSGATAVSATDVLGRTFDLVPLPVHLAALVAVGIAARRRAWAPLSLAAGAAAYVVVELGLTVVGGYEGVARFVYPVLALESVLAGVGVAWVMEGAATWLAPRVRARDPAFAQRAPRIAAATVALAAVPIGAWRVAHLVDQLEPTTARAGFYEDLGDLVARAGGPERLRACGIPYASSAQAPAVAWRLRVHIPRVRTRPRPPGVVFRVAPRERAGIESNVLPVQKVSVSSRRFRRSALAGPWEALAACRATSRS
ncbi:MAG: hypothetical protein ACR2ML_01600 [Solirubrobacteraceae bacterium]